MPSGSSQRGAALSGGCCWPARPSRSPMSWPIRNTHIPICRKEPIGVLFLCRKTVEPFTDKQVELVSTFADQAVIAIENVRLFDEVQAKTRELSEALTYQTGSTNI